MTTRPLPRPGTRSLAAALAVVLVAVALAGCGAAVSPAPEPAVTPRPTVSPAVEATRLRLDAALRMAGFGLVESRAAARPPEPAAFGPIGRFTFGVPLAAEAAPVLVAVYEFADPAAARAGAETMAAFVASGPGSVTHPPDSRFVIGVLGSTVVFHAWSPANAADPAAADKIAAALATVGTQVVVAPR